jgi:2-oxo-3-hexenedioate decarboxylase
VQDDENGPRLPVANGRRDSALAEELAERLAAAIRDRTKLSPLTDSFPELDDEVAYQAQWAGVRARLDSGEVLVGAKLGLTSKIKQRVMNVDSPIYGWVTSGMLGEHGEPVELAELIHPRAEPEIAFLLGRDLPAPATVTSVLAATEAVFAGIDVIDSRYADFRFTRPDVIADNASAGRFLLGPLAVPPTGLVDLALLGCVLRVDGEVVATAAGAASMGHPAAAVAWLANQLARRGQSLTAGMLIFSGGLTEPVTLRRGSSVAAEFDGLGAIELSVR